MPQTRNKLQITSVFFFTVSSKKVFVECRGNKRNELNFDFLTFLSFWITLYVRGRSPDQSNQHLPAHGLVPVYVGHELHHRPQQGSLCPHVGGNSHAEQLSPLHTVAQLVADKCHKSQIIKIFVTIQKYYDISSQFAPWRVSKPRGLCSS